MTQFSIRWDLSLNRLSQNRGQVQFDVVIERDEEGVYATSVPQLPGCHTDGTSLDELMVNIREAIELCVEVQGQEPSKLEFVGVQRVTVAA